MTGDFFKITFNQITIVIHIFYRFAGRFITIFRIKQKLIVSLILMLVVSTFVGLITFSESNVKFYSYLIIILLTGIEIIVYAAVLGLLLRLSKKDVQATHIAIYLLFSLLFNRLKVHRSELN